MADFRNEDVWLMQGNCLDRMKEVEDGSVDMVLCDPPYQKTQNSWDSIIPLELMWKELWRVLKPNGVVFLPRVETLENSIEKSIRVLSGYNFK